METLVERYLLKAPSPSTNEKQDDKKRGKNKESGKGQDDDERPVARLRWIMKKPRAIKMQQDLKDVRFLILGELTHMSWSLHLDLRKTIQAQLSRQEELILRLLPSTENSSIPRTTDTEEDATEVNTNKSHLVKRRGKTAKPELSQATSMLPRRPKSPLSGDMTCDGCQCNCHRTWSLMFSTWGNLAGTTVLRSRGSPLTLRGCNMPSTCKRQARPMMSGSFYFPHWLASRAIVMTLLSGPSPSISLTLARIVSPESDLFRYIQTGDCDGLQTLFLKGDASPADMMQSLYGTLDALLFALNCNQYQVCQLLLSWGADPHAENSTKLTDSAANMAWNLSIECPSPANDDRRRLIEKTFPRPRDLERRNFSQAHKTVLGLSFVDLDKLLQNSTLDEINAVDCHGRTAVFWAAWRGDIDALTRMLQKGADPDLSDGGGRAPIHYSAMTASAACTAGLVDIGGADPDKRDNYGETPLHCACSCARRTNVEYLLSAGADVNAANSQGRTPLMSAVMSRDAVIVSILLAYEAEVDARDTAGETALGLAVWMDSPEIVSVLIGAGARLDLAVTDSGRTILHTAAQYGSVATMEALLCGFTDCSSSSSRGERRHFGIGSMDAQGMTALERLRQRKDCTAELVEIFGAVLVSAETFMWRGDAGEEEGCSKFKGAVDLEESSSISSDSDGDIFVMARAHPRATTGQPTPDIPDDYG
ncbi:ankyrin repeat-containing domain protein [Rhypophila decipiens]|uniref:Ankyrin repeat-containing domain protein n=1 Tax=Rhypophila decipiens TaxID=261697 RepID=A0AAN6YJG5_9PEZI|nr:ankyrin repeat-containing domain protein [Rhypophila decipiens]